MIEIEELIYCFKIIFFFAIGIFLYIVAVQYQKKSIRFQLSGVTSKKRFVRFGIFAVIICCILIGIYSTICGQVPYSSDRGNYALRFSDDIYLSGVKQASLGLYWIEIILHIFTYNPQILFFMISAVYLFLTLTAYNQYPEAEPRALLYAGVSNFFIFSFYLLKQGPAISLIAISVAAFFKKKKVLWLLTLMIAICFHESALIMIPVFFLLSGAKRQWVRIVQYILLIVCVVGFRQIAYVISSTLGAWIPALGYQLGDYFKNSVDDAGNIMTIVKGLPYYVVTFYAMLKRNVYRDRIKNYDSYLMLSFFVSVTTVMSAYMYWMWRFAAYGYFPIFIFASLLYREAKGKKDREFVGWIFGGSLFFFAVRVLFQYYFLHGGI